MPLLSPSLEQPSLRQVVPTQRRHRDGSVARVAQPASAALLARGDTSLRAASLLELQRLAGNRAAASLVTRAREATVQRCRGHSCHCSDHQSDVTALTPVQRHAGVDHWRTKFPLESADLASPGLQRAASTAARALAVGRSSGTDVRSLQEALAKAGYATPISGTYDTSTQRSVAAFQAAHRIPYPTGREAGPKTLSTLDDHLKRRKAPPKPAKEDKCREYSWDEWWESRHSVGRSSRTGEYGQHLTIYNFGAGQDRLKPEHLQALKDWRDEFSLYDPCTTWKVTEIIGFTDSVDRADLNEQLRFDRANSAAGWLQTNAVPSAPDGGAAKDGSYDAGGCKRDARTLARRVVIRLGTRPKAELEPCKDQPPKPKPPKNEKCEDMATTRWSLQGVMQAGPPLKPGASATALSFMLRAKDEAVGYTKATRMIKFVGVGGGASVSPSPISIPLPSETSFTTHTRRKFDDFNGGGTVRDAGVSFGIGYSLMQGVVHPGTDPRILDLSGWQVGLGVGFEWVGGRWEIVGGCF